MIKFLSGKDKEIKGKTVFLRVDVNEPLDKNGHLLDDFRIQAIVPTIKLLQQQECKIILCGHLGRPQGHEDTHLSLKPVAARLAELLNIKFVTAEQELPDYPVEHLVLYTGDVREKRNQEQIKSASKKDLIFLENIRFYPEEESCNEQFAATLAGLADAYVNEAFSVSHHGSASIVGAAKNLPAFGGPLLQKEIKNLEYVLTRPQHPFVLMMGGIKISDKEKTVINLGQHADKLLLGGGLANMLLQAQGIEIGNSVVEEKAENLAAQLLRNYKNKIVLPKDVVVANKQLTPSSIRAIPVYNVRKNEIILDIGPQTILEYSRILKTAKMIVWNGPLGRFEIKPFHTGTMALARIIGGRSKGPCFGVVGGGETVDAVRLAHQQEYIDHLSTGGGAMLEYLAGNKLPGLEVLEK
jgi:phosphoglycerate kinase